MRYRIWKSGLEFFDLARAYGLASYLYAISGFQESIQISELPALFFIESEKTISPKPNFLKSEAWQSEWVSEDWGYVFKTLSGRNKILTGDKKKKARDFLEAKVSTIIKRYDWQAEVFLENEVPKQRSSDFDTVWGTLDPSAIKGIRGASLAASVSQNPIMCDIANWSLALFGAKVSFFPFGQYVIAPFPSKIDIRSIKSIQARFKKEKIKVKKYGARYVAAWFAVRLNHWLLEGFISEDDSFWRIGCFELSKGKILSGAFLDMSVLNDFLRRVRREPKNDKLFSSVSSLLRLWDDIFLYASNIKGGEEIALPLADFIFNLSFDNYERHIFTLFRKHLRSISQKTTGRKSRSKKRKLKIYNKELLEEVMRYVEVM